METNHPRDPKQQFKALDRTVPFVGQEGIDTECLECFEYEYADHVGQNQVEVVTETDEFTSVCPYSGLPDFAHVTITYTPDRLCLELRALKYYLMSYRNVGIWYEHLINRMLDDLVAACQPQMMTIVIACKPRGGLSSTVSAHYTRD